MSEILTAREATGEVTAALRKRFTPESIAAVVDRLPMESQTRISAEFAERPVRRIVRVRKTRKT